MVEFKEGYFLMKSKIYFQQVKFGQIQLSLYQVELSHANASNLKDLKDLILMFHAIVN